MQCPKCKKVLDDSIRFCPDDGTPLSDTAAVAGVPTPFGRESVSREIPLPTVVGGRYRVEEVRGGGGMAKVYRAVDITLQREVAVKLINAELRTEPEFDARFQREARIASQLADPHIVVVHDFGIDGSHGPFLVMEFLQGQSLRERLQSDGPMPVKAALQLSAQLFLALIHAHGKGIVHRDIKPDNIFLLNQSGVRLHVRVLDFGIARIYRGDEAGANAVTLTNPGAVLGTPRYMSPEQLAGQPVDARSDLYSAALVLFEALTGQLPYASSKRLCELCPEATPPLQDLLEHCLKQNPAERPPSAVEVYLRLQDLGKASGILLLPPGAMDKLVASRKSQDPTVPYVPLKSDGGRSRRWLLLGAAVGALLLGLATVGYLFWRPTYPITAEEKLLDVRIGDPYAEVVDRLKLTRAEDASTLWQGDRPPSWLGHVLRPKDVSGGQLKCQRSADGSVCVFFRDDKACAVVVTEPHAGSSARRVKIGSDLNTLARAYDGLEPDTDQHSDKVMTWRYDTLGIGFEIKSAKIVGITLYPRSPE